MTALWGADDEVPPPDAYIDRTFGEGGYLARRWGAGYQPRAGQIAFARAVDRAIVGRGHLLCEAPTGTGKSLGYSVPATYHAATRGQIVVLVTANIALQEQLVKKDLPLLAEILPWSFTYGLLKGRSNYLCRSQYEQVRLASQQQSMFDPLADPSAPREERDRLRLLIWGESVIAQRGYGDQSELDWKPADRLWRDFSVAPDECRGSRCAFYDTCGAIRAQRAARGSQVVVTNYHIFFTNLLIYLERGEDVVLPPFDVAVFDEAHAAANIARDFFGWRISEGSVRRVARHFRNSDPGLTEKIERAAGWFFEQMLQLRRDRDRYKARIVPERLSGYDIESAENLLIQLGVAHERLQNEILGLDSTGGVGRDRAGAAEILDGRVMKLGGAVRSLLDEPADNEVLFLEEDEFRKAHVACRLVRPSQVLRGALFGKTKTPADEDGQPTGAPEPISVVCTSATLATESGFEFAKSELGVVRAEELVVDSPFDYEEQALLILPDVCDPSAPEFTREVAGVLLRTIELARGRTLGLFTSRKRMTDVYEAIAGKTPFRILRQDDGQRSQIIEEFKRDTHSVLLGVASFWAGVDVPGESLSVVFIDKIPFPTPDDPVLERLMEADKRAWAGYAVPRAIIEFKQGFGRLIRSRTDRGVVVCCDNRILTKGYGKQFLRAMPKAMQKIKNLEAIRDWLDGPAAAEEVDPLS